MRAWASLVVLFAVLAVGCGPEIGDSCETPLDCSSQGSRLCDRTQPGGYCTLMGCERGTCPEEADCVRFRPSVERLAVTFCMARCEKSSDCRESEGYACLHAEDFGDAKGAGALEAKNLDEAKGGFCALPSSPAPTPPEKQDAGTGPDAGTGTDAAAGSDAGARTDAGAATDGDAGTEADAGTDAGAADGDDAG